MTMAADPFDEPRFIECPNCGGDCEFAHLTGYDPRDGSPTGWIERCPTCRGRGEIEAELAPMTQDDLDERDKEGGQQ
jgi:hypothetical protein